MVLVILCFPCDQCESRAKTLGQRTIHSLPNKLAGSEVSPSYAPPFSPSLPLVGGQEPGPEDAIENFCTLNFGVSFPMMAKVEVNGAQAHPVYQVGRREGSSGGGGGGQCEGGGVKGAVPGYAPPCLYTLTSRSPPPLTAPRCPLPLPLFTAPTHCPLLSIHTAPLHAQYLKSEKKQMFMELIKWNFEK